MGSVATVAGAPMIVPASALGRGGRPAPSERVNVACIGMGTVAMTTTMAFLHEERAQVVSIADVNKESGHYWYNGQRQGGREVGRRMANEHYAKQAGQAAYKGCTAYEDFREMLEREDIDAVNISTPDHWHERMVIYCARNGKHIYGQKPLSLTVAEGRRMVTEVTRAGITWQTGSQHRSGNYFREAVEFVRNGRLGDLKTIKVGLPGGHRDFNTMADRTAPEPVPEGLNWEFWLGPAPRRDYCPALHPLNWRHNFDYSGGGITDNGAHYIDIAQWALDMEASGPALFDGFRAELPPPGQVYDVPTKFHFECEYANGARLLVADSPEFEEGVTFEGEGGRSIFASPATIRMNPPELRRDRIRDDEIRVYRSIDHIGNFIDCIYSGGPTVAPIETAHRTVTIAHLANIAIRLGRPSLKWDPEKEEILGDPEASGMLSRPIREEWALV